MMDGSMKGGGSGKRVDHSPGHQKDMGSKPMPGMKKMMSQMPSTTKASGKK